MPKSVAVVHAAASHWSQLVIEELASASVEVIPIEIESFRKTSGQRSDPRRLVLMVVSFLRAVATIGRRRPDRLLCLYGGTNAVVSVALAVICRNRRPAVFLGGSDFYRIRGLSRVLAFAAYRRADVLLCAGEQLAADVESEGSLGAAIAWHHGTRLPPLPDERITRPENSVRIVVSRSLEAVYDPSTVMKACEEISTDYEVELDFLASGKQADVYRTEAGLYSSNHRLTIVFRDGYEPQELPALLRSSHIFVSANHSDGLPTSVIECVLNGVPMVLSDIPANRSLLEVLGTSDTPLFEPGSAAGLASALRASIEGYEVRALAAYEMAHRYRSKFDSKRAVGELLQHLG